MSDVVNLHPVEEAPKDGTWILGLCEDLAQGGKRPAWYVVQFDKCTNSSEPDEYGDIPSDWVEASGEGYMKPVLLGWIPLPPTPDI